MPVFASHFSVQCQTDCGVFPLRGISKTHIGRWLGYAVGAVMLGLVMRRMVIPRFFSSICSWAAWHCRSANRTLYMDDNIAVLDTTKAQFRRGLQFQEKYTVWTINSTIVQHFCKDVVVLHKSLQDLHQNVWIFSMVWPYQTHSCLWTYTILISHRSQFAASLWYKQPSPPSQQVDISTNHCVQAYQVINLSGSICHFTTFLMHQAR